MNQKHRVYQICGINHDLKKNIKLSEWTILPQYGVSSTAVALLPGHWPSWRDSRALFLVFEGFPHKSRRTHTYECIQRVTVPRVYEWITVCDSYILIKWIMPCKSIKHEKWISTINSNNNVELIILCKSINTGKWIRCLDCTMSKKWIIPPESNSMWKWIT